MLRLAPLPLAVDDVEVDLDRVADGQFPVGRDLHKQQVLQDRGSTVSGLIVGSDCMRFFYVRYIQGHGCSSAYRLTLVFVYSRLHLPYLLSICRTVDMGDKDGQHRVRMIICT